MVLTDARRRALAILRNHPEGLTAHAFGDLMWPDSPAHTRVYNVGHGATAGAALWRSAGAYLGKLRHAGLVAHHWHMNRVRLNFISNAGRAALRGTVEGQATTPEESSDVHVVTG